MMEEKWRSKLASKEQCEKFKRNFGGIRTMIPYLEQTEQVSIQGLDHWIYETGAPRAAETSLTLPRVYYFLRDVTGGTIDSLLVPSVRVRTQSVEGMGLIKGAVQTRIGTFVVTEDEAFLVTKSKDSDEIRRAPRQAPPVKHEKFALTAYGDKYLVQTGGKHGGNYKKTTLFYNFEADEWKEGPDLNEARQGHSSCSLGDFTYIIAGVGAGNNLNSIERLNAQESILETECFSLTHQWELVQVSGATLKPCTVPLVCQLNDKELLILGGIGNKHRALALHHESLELRLLSNCLSINVEARHNQGVKVSKNKVAACVYNMIDHHRYVITYTPEQTRQIKIVKDLGSLY